MAQGRLLWAFLQGSHPVEDFKELNLEGFDWSSLASDGKTLLVTAIRSALGQPKESLEDSLQIIEWLVRSGASIEQECTGGQSDLFFIGREKSTTVKLECKGLNAIEYVTEWQDKLNDLPAWEEECAFLPKILRILYTCSAQVEPDHQTALQALDLAHRWQVEVVVAILTDLLAGMITEKSFVPIAEHAVLKGLERLKTAAKSFRAGSTKVQAGPDGQADLKKGRLPAAVLELFPASKPSKPNEPKPKRRRM
eukprot:s1389_g24.t1